MSRSSLVSRCLLVVFLGLFLAGCASTGPRVSYPIVPPGSRLDIEDPMPRFTKRIEVRILETQPRRTAVITGEGSLQRTGVEWSVTWFDADARVIPGTSSRFRRATVNPGVLFQLEAQAPVPEAQFVHVRLRQANNL